MRRLTALAAVAVALAGCGSPPPSHGLSIRVDKDPFRIAVVRDGKVVVAQNAAGRLRYQLLSTGDQYKLTKVTATYGETYEVATSEPGRTATVKVASIPDGFRISLRLHPETNVQLVIDAFDAGPGDHFLGGGERGGAVDLRGQIVPVK